GEAGGRRGAARPAGEIAPGDAHELPPPPAARLGEEARLGRRRIRGQCGRARGEVLRRQAPLEIAALDEAGKDLRVTRAGLRYEVARAEDRSNRVANGERRSPERLSR